jgi:hypothetical protein
MVYAASGGSALAPTTALATGNLLCKQTVSGCESARTSVKCNSKYNRLTNSNKSIKILQVIQIDRCKSIMQAEQICNGIVQQAEAPH